MKKKLIALAVTLLILGAVAGCEEEKPVTVNDKKLKVISTGFVGFDFARNVGGDKAEVSMLLPPGSESHSYEPTAQDINKIKAADVFIYVGGHNDEWVEKILGSIEEKQFKTIKLMETVELLPEETTEGMQADKGHNHSHDIAHGDEHVWTSPRNAVKIVEKIAEVMGTADVANQEIYNKNARTYIEKLEKLDADFKKVVAEGKRKTVIFGDRFPLTYFVKAYDLEYYAAFPGCSTDTEPSAATVAFLIDKVKEEEIPVVFHIELSNEKIADTIVEATGAKKMLFSACHNVTKEQFNNGVGYLELMEANVEALKEALN